MDLNNLYDFNIKIIGGIKKIKKEENIFIKAKYILMKYMKKWQKKIVSSLEYKILDKNKELRIFGNRFMDNNEYNFEIIVNNKTCELTVFFWYKRFKYSK